MVQMFDARGVFRPLSEIEPQLVDCSPDTRQRFESVRTAALASQSAAEAVKAAQSNITLCLAEVKHANAKLLSLRPPVTHTEAARAFIRSEQSRQR
jgi:hypothetical protein